MKGDAIRMVTKADLADIDRDIEALAGVAMELARWQDDLFDATRAIIDGDLDRAREVLDRADSELLEDLNG